MEARKNMEKHKKICFWGWGMVILILLIVIGFSITGFPWERYTLPCLLLKTTGIYCPGCGGTRAVLALLRGEVFKSCYYHPVVLYAAIVGGWYLLSNTIEWLSLGKISIGMKMKDRYWYIGLVLIVCNWIGKNLFF